MGPGARPHTVFLNNTKKVKRHDDQLAADRRKIGYDADMKIEGLLEKKTRAEMREILPSHLQCNIMSDPADGSEEIIKRERLRKEEMVADRLKEAKREMGDMKKLKRGPAETDSEREDTYDAADEDSDMEAKFDGLSGAALRDAKMRDLMGLDLDEFMELCGEDPDEELQQEEEELQCDYQSPFFSATLDQLKTLVYDNIRSKGMSDITDKRLRHFISIATTEDGKPKNKKAARKLLAAATYFSGKTYDCCRNSCMSFYKYKEATKCLDPNCNAPRYRVSQIRCFSYSHAFWGRRRNTIECGLISEV